MSAGPPREIFGPYRVYEKLGVGGMAEVHRAEVHGADAQDADEPPRVVALKRMLPHVASNQDLVQAFAREGRLGSLLQHPNVPRTYEVGLIAGTYFIAMEYIAGPTLREVLQHCGPTTGPVPVPVALNIINQLCDAVDYAHNLADDSGVPLGIIHRDVSPSNVIVAPGGVVKLIDFGIAKVTKATMQTMSGTIKGKFGYMAPEYVGGHLDARADLFALGVIAHELLTNRPLFTAPDDRTTLQRVQLMEVLPPSQLNRLVPKAIDEIVMTALERDPERRWQQASALRSAMTTLTQRLGMVIPDADVVTWLDAAFERTRPQVHTAPPPRDTASASASGSGVIEPPRPDVATVTDADPTAIELAAAHSATTQPPDASADDLSETLVRGEAARTQPPLVAGGPLRGAEGHARPPGGIPSTMRGAGTTSVRRPPAHAPEPGGHVATASHGSAASPRLAPSSAAAVQRMQAIAPAPAPRPVRSGAVVVLVLLAVAAVATTIYLVLSRII